WLINFMRARWFTCASVFGLATWGLYSLEMVSPPEVVKTTAPILPETLPKSDVFLAIMTE
ncbi:hypothetical protein ACQUWZ_25445, partial [Ralstonia pseudosolanacearum]|uniref:hypothetical protein n=1 Tax=Ralstonia pseudosolanacearum TaxID=1310165 RepID=UPI003D183FA5